MDHVNGFPNLDVIKDSVFARTIRKPQFIESSGNRRQWLAKRHPDGFTTPYPFQRAKDASLELHRLIFNLFNHLRQYLEFHREYITILLYKAMTKIFSKASCVPRDSLGRRRTSVRLSAG